MVSDNFKNALQAEKESLEKEDYVGGLFSSIADARSIDIPKELVDFMRVIVQQSLDFRQEEWASYPPGWVRSIVDHSLRRIMRGTESYAVADGKPLLSLVSVLENIRNEWTGIYPICR